MTNEEIFPLVVEELGDVAKDFEPMFLSTLLIFEWMEELYKNGIIQEDLVQTSEKGRAASQLCKDKGWEVSNNDIAVFCKDMVNEGQRESFLMMLIAMRDDKEKFLEHAKKHIDLNI